MKTVAIVITIFFGIPVIKNDVYQIKGKSPDCLSYIQI
jgi:hypothetical protein